MASPLPILIAGGGIGEPVVRVPLGDVARAAYGYTYGVIYRVDIHNVFLDACKAQSNITLRTNAKLASYAQDARGVRVTLADGEVVEGCALVGADGLWSKVRELLDKIETWKMWVLCDREPVQNWSDNRVTLLGDAAHPMLQYLAPGRGAGHRRLGGVARGAAPHQRRCRRGLPQIPAGALPAYRPGATDRALLW
jgi:2-polyprenyl-6-methoxyphenol hydroxylase-like FAD-dependent oxidoreductase